MSIVQTKSHLSFVTRNYKRLKVYDKMDGSLNECYFCHSNDPDKGTLCQTCDVIVCPNCHPLQRWLEKTVFWRANRAKTALLVAKLRCLK